jgi:hypothetical protein
MAYVKWTIIAVFWLSLAGFLHYTLPQNDVVRLTETYEKRVDPGENSWFWAAPDAGNAVVANRDVFFIQSIQVNNRPMVYRNEDTGWGWPPYFKFDTSNLQAQAADLKSVKANPQWVMIKHYGWRNEFFSIYPNAVSVQAVDSPDATKIPVLNIIILTLLSGLFLYIYRRWRRFRAARIDPVLENVEDAMDSASDKATGFFGRISAWFKTWRK